MKSLIINKIASVTKNARLSNPICIDHKIRCSEGAIIIVKILEDKLKYNKLELVSGRLSTLNKGDLVAVALGNRKALKGFVGEIPNKLKPGDIINILNLGGVAGICTSENLYEVGKALKARVLGSVINGQKSLFIKDSRLFPPQKNLKTQTPLIIISGTCMHVGKTNTACKIIKYGTNKGLHISGAKLAGIAAMKDTEKMKDYGATETVSFVDAGLTSTVDYRLSVAAAKGAINYLSNKKPDYIVLEFGDGLFGEYGVMNILQDKQIQKQTIAHIGCAHDPVGAIKLAEVCKQIGNPLDLISGPVTDNSVGTDFIKTNLGIPAINAINAGEKLFNSIQKVCLKK